ncbi:MAG: hypothetical protein GX443_12240 [Deltaproteobacteria bacterium]|nr:hypothetical protein [Deltaproteobacteria bacterium]
MQRPRLLLFLAVAFFMAVGLADRCHAYMLNAGIWQPTDGDFNALKFDINCLEGKTIDLYLYNPSTTPPSNRDLNIFSGSSPSITIGGVKIQGGTISFTMDSQGHHIATLGSDSLDLGPSGLFGLYMEDHGTGSDGDISPVFIAENQWKLIDDCAIITVTDANPVPIPGPAWLLGSGLLGMAGVKRRLEI